MTDIERGKNLELESARRLVQGLKAVESIFAVFSYGLIAVLGALYYAGLIDQLWVLALPAIQLLALKVAIGGYVGARVAPRVIAEKKRNATPE